MVAGGIQRAGSEMTASRTFACLKYFYFSGQCPFPSSALQILVFAGVFQDNVARGMWDMVIRRPTYTFNKKRYNARRFV